MSNILNSVFIISGARAGSTSSTKIYIFQFVNRLIVQQHFRNNQKMKFKTSRVEISLENTYERIFF